MTRKLCQKFQDENQYATKIKDNVIFPLFHEKKFYSWMQNSIQFYWSVQDINFEQNE